MVHRGGSFSVDPGSDGKIGPNVKAVYELPAEKAKRVPLPSKLHPDLAEALERAGFPRLYSHQAEGLKRLLYGENVILSTPTASGKSLVYQIFALDAWLRDPSSRFLFVYPFKALTQDQFAKMNEFSLKLGFSEFKAAVYDGDTRSAERTNIRKKPAQVIMTNPDMLHLAFMAFHQNWKPFFKDLKMVVLDEAHVYRGVFGANVHHLLWRFGRVLDDLGADPRWVATSATLSGPGRFFHTLTGREAHSIEKSGAPQPSRRLYLLSTEGGSPYTLACDVMHKLLKEGTRTLTFTKARRTTELIYAWLCRRDKRYKKLVSSYRAGFLPSERRRIEKAFFDGSLMGVVSTSAMEVGIDVGGLDACILVGYPGSLISLFQRMGRVGRGDREAAVFLIAMQDALDQYFVKNPDALLDRPIEELVLDPENPIILGSHLLCAAKEKPLVDSEVNESGAARQAVETLDRSGELMLDEDGSRWHTLRRNPHREVNLRSMGESYRIVDANGKAVGTVGGYRAYKECHEGAVYLHHGKSYIVKALSHKDRLVFVEQSSVDYYTQVLSDKETEILEVTSEKEMKGCLLRMGRLKVTEIITSYVKKDMASGEKIAEYPLESPPIVFETEGFWVVFPSGAERLVTEKGLHFMGGIHAFEHALIGIFPLRALSDRWDIGGISYPHHPQVKGPAVFIYDGYPGGIGLSRKGFEIFEDLLEVTAKQIGGCPCEEGCPACIQSPKCGSGNKPLDKEAAVLLTSALRGREKLPAGERKTRVKSKPAQSKAATKKREKPPGRLVFDLETQRLAAQVGGWGHIADMRLALAVVWDLDSNEWRTYFEEEVEDLVDDLLAAPLVVGFNVDRFDLTVLRPYTKRDLGKVKTLDLLKVIKKRLGFRVSLASLSETNFGEAKSADGVQSVQWFREGRFDLIESYCRKDVELTGKLYLKGLEENFVLIDSRSSGRLRLNVNGWK